MLTNGDKLSRIGAPPTRILCNTLYSMIQYAEEVDHDFRGMQLLLTRTILCQVQFLLTQRVDLGCGGVR